VRGTRRGGDIYDIADTGGEPRRLTHSGSDDSSPAWSPTGRTLAFARRGHGGDDLYLLSADGSRKRQLTSLPGDESEPAWSPDGRWIAFAHRRAGRRRVYLVRMGRAPVRRFQSRRLHAFSSASRQAHAPQWQPAGLDPVVAAAGDIACDPTNPSFGAGLGSGAFCRQRQTSDLLFRMDLVAILAAGDLQYEDGALWKFEQSFEPSWGRLKPLIRPVPGNHEYDDPDATGYFDYFNGPSQQTGPAGDDLEFTSGFNVNGIDTAPDGRGLIVVQTNLGKLFRVDPRSGVTHEIKLDRPVTNGDGILRLGHTLYVVQNQDNKVAVVRLDGRLRNGRTRGSLTDPRLDVPTTIAPFRNFLYAVNARFNLPDNDDDDIVRLRASR
jgi:hypothetical protein